MRIAIGMGVGMQQRGITGTPSVTVGSTLEGRTLIITTTGLTGDPTPSVALTTLTLDGVNVIGDAISTGPWSYVVPDSAEQQSVFFQITATNTAGSATASDTVLVFENLFAPEAINPPTITGSAVPDGTVTITEGTYSGDTPITITGVLTLDGVDVTANMVGANYTIPAATVGQILQWSETASNGVSPNATQNVSVTVVDAGVAPSFNSSSFDSGTDTLSANLSGTTPITVWWVFDASATAPSVAQVKAGQDNAGAAADLSGSETGLVEGANSFAGPDTSLVGDGDYYLYLVASNAAGDSAVQTIGPITVTSAPTAFEAVVADGDSLTRGALAGLTGDKTKILLAVNGSRATGPDALARIVDVDTGRVFRMQVTATGELRAGMGTSSFRAGSTFPTSGRETIILAVDTEAATIADGVQLYRNGTLINSATFTSVVWGTTSVGPLESGNVSICNNAAGSGNQFNGNLGFVYLSFPDTLPDLSLSTERDKFLPGAIIPSNGSSPTGAAPSIFVTGPAADVNTDGNNLGNGGTFTVVGTFADEV